MELIDVYQAENMQTVKDIIEEAITQAFVRKCNNCHKAFLKEGGYNKMKCPYGNLQCYLWGQNVVDYSHFDKLAGGKLCLLHSDMQVLLRRQVPVALDRTV